MLVQKNFELLENRVQTVWSKFDQQMVPEQMFSWQLATVKNVPRNLHLQFGQNRVSNSLDILDMDKCCHDKCCLDKCLRDSSVQDGPRNLPLKFC